jgi:tight adherence protein B
MMAAARWRRRRLETRLAADLPDALDRLAADLRSGGSLTNALEALAAGPGSLAGDLRRVCGRAAAGGLDGALAVWVEERSHPAVAATAGALAVAAEVGGRSAAALEGLAAGLRDQQDLREEAAAQAAQARLSAAVVTLAPIGSLGFSLAADRRVAATLVHAGAGRACLAAGLGLEALAWIWIRRLVRARGAPA